MKTCVYCGDSMSPSHPALCEACAIMEREERQAALRFFLFMLGILPVVLGSSYLIALAVTR